MAKFTMNSLPAQLTPEELAELEAAEKKPIIYDDDCPEMTSEMLRQFHKMDRVTIQVSPGSMKKIKSFGPDYAKILSHLPDLALNDAELVKKCIFWEQRSCFDSSFHFSRSALPFSKLDFHFHLLS